MKQFPSISIGDHKPTRYTALTNQENPEKESKIKETLACQFKGGINAKVFG